MTFADLLKRAQRLDASALTEIHEQYYPVVYRYVRFRMSDEQVCEDITAEVFLRLMDALNKKSGPTHNLRGWLFGTASNLVNDHFRTYYARKTEPADLGGDEISVLHYAEDLYEEEWVQQQVVDAFQDLTPEQQHVLALRFSDERSIDETASIMGKSVNAVKALQFRAVASLRRLLEDRMKE
jgi:RNA polymerase sigma-70 factor (ECF subfamily)